MRVRSLAAAAVVAAGMFAAPAGAEPSGSCAGGVGNAAVVDANGRRTAVCVTQGPVKGSFTVQGRGSTDGYVVADGDSTNPSPLDGYAGIQLAGTSNQTGFVGSCSGDYTFTQPANSVDPTSCDY